MSNFMIFIMVCGAVLCFCGVCDTVEKIAFYKYKSKNPEAFKTDEKNDLKDNIKKIRKEDFR